MYCEHCGSEYVEKRSKKDEIGDVTTYYYCFSCKKTFPDREAKPKPIRKQIMRLKLFDGKEVRRNDLGRIWITHSDYEVEIYKREDGVFEFYQKGYGYGLITVAPRIYTGNYYNTGNCYICYSSIISKYKPGIEGYVREIYLNDELTKEAKNNEAMRAIQNGPSERFYVPADTSNRKLFDDVCTWIREKGGFPQENLQKTSSGHCYVATCVYGSYDCPEVWTLRRFRDNILLPTWYGRCFVKIYYKISPILVKWFGHMKWFKCFCKKRLDNMVENLQAHGIESTKYDDQKL